MRVLIIGGTGFIGQRVVKKLYLKGETPIVMARRPKVLPEETQGKVESVAGDVRVYSDVVKVIKDYKIDSIINAAYMLTGEGEANPYMASQVNSQGTCNVFEAARISGVKRVIFCSSIAAYASQDLYGDRYVTEEEDLMKPNSIYGAAKVFNEFIASRFENKYGIEIPSVRIGAVYGSGREDRGVTAWTSHMVSSAIKGKQALINIRPDQLASFIYVDDSAEQLVRLCLKEKLKYRIYNSGGATSTPNEFLQILKKYYPQADIKFNPEAPQWPYPHKVDGRKMEEETGFKLRSTEECLLEQIKEEMKMNV